MAPPRSNVRLLCLLALLQLGVGPLVIVTLCCVGHVAKPVVQSVASHDSNEVRAQCSTAVEHWLDQVTHLAWSEEATTPNSKSDEKSKPKSKADSTKLWTWQRVTPPDSTVDDQPIATPAWRLRAWTPAWACAPPGPPPRASILAA